MLTPVRSTAFRCTVMPPSSSTVQPALLASTPPNHAPSATPTPRPSAASRPRCCQRGCARSFSSTSRMPMSGHSLPSASASPACDTLRRRSSSASIPRAIASSSMALSIANACWVMPGARYAPIDGLCVITVWPRTSMLGAR